MAVALVVAAGSGERLGAPSPKAFVVLAGRPMLEWSLEALRAAGVQRIVIAVPPEPVHWEPDPDVIVVAGGAARSHSVRNALVAAPGEDPVLVHDAARPLAEPSLFSRCLEALGDADAAIAAAQVTDTVKESDADGLVVSTLDRSRLWAVQTPQAFRRPALQRALDQPDEVLATATDDAGLVERTGGRVRVVPASPANLKVTTPLDLRIAEDLLRERC